MTGFKSQTSAIGSDHSAQPVMSPQNGQRLFKFYKSGQISTNLVTLLFGSVNFIFSSLGRLGHLYFLEHFFQKIG